MKTYIVDIDDTICRTPKINGKPQYDKSEPIQYKGPPPTKSPAWPAG